MPLAPVFNVGRRPAVACVAWLPLPDWSSHRPTGAPSAAAGGVAGPRWDTAGGGLGRRGGGSAGAVLVHAGVGLQPELEVGVLRGREAAPQGRDEASHLT